MLTNHIRHGGGGGRSLSDLLLLSILPISITLVAILGCRDAQDDDCLSRAVASADEALTDHGTKDGAARNEALREHRRVLELNRNAKKTLGNDPRWTDPEQRPYLQMAMSDTDAAIKRGEARVAEASGLCE